MKTIDFKQYNEKLKINPINANDFKNIDMHQIEVSNILDYDKISQYDIMKVKQGDYFMMFKYKTDFTDTIGDRQYEKLKKLLHYVKYDLFAHYNRTIDTFSTLSIDNLKNGTYSSRFSIVELWKAPKNMTIALNTKFGNKDLEKMISYFEYKLVYKHEDN